MPEQIIVKHEIDLGQLERFEKALKEFKEGGDVKKIVRQLAEMGELKDKINKKTKEELGIVGKLKQEYKELKKTLDLAKTQKEISIVNKRIREVVKELKKAKETTTGWSKAIGSFAFKFNVLANVISNVASVISTKLNQALKGAIDTVREFESAMAGVRAISQATDEEFKRLQQDAIRLGGSTIYTATQVAKLQMAYAKLGFSTQEILNATEATLSLAAATDEDLAEAALVAGSTVRAFNMDVVETQRVVDVMAKSFTSSALNLEHWKESMKFASSIAEGTGLNVETLSAAMAVLADRGIKGSIAGTSMKNILIRMGDASSGLAKKIGFVVNSSESFLAALEELNKQGTTLTEVFALTDRRAAPAMRILIEMEEIVRKTKEEFIDAGGAAKEMADVRMDTLKGSLTIMKSAWEKLVISFNEGTGIFTVGLRKIVDWITKVIMKISELTLDNETWMKQFGEFEGSRMVQEFTSTLVDSKDKTKAISEELKRVQEEYDRVLSDKKEIAKLTKSDLTEEEQGQGKRVEWVKKTWNKIVGIYKLSTGSIITDQEALAIVTGKSDKRIDTLTKTFKKQKEEIDKTAAAMGAYKNELEQWLIREELLKKAKIEEELLFLLKSEKEKWILWKKMEQFRIAGMKEGLDKELAINNYKWEVLIHQAKEAKADTTALNERWKEENIKIAIEYGEKEIEATKKYHEQIYREDYKRFKANQELALKRLKLTEATQEEIIIAEIKFYNERIEYLGEFGESYLGEIVDLYLKIKELQDGLGIEEEKGGFLKMFFPEMKPEQEKKITTQLIKLGNFALDTIRDINRERQRIADMAVNRYNQEINELQRSLDIQLELSKEGKANRLQQVQEELAETQRLREKALVEQERLMERQRKIESTMQALNLATTISELLKAAGLSGPLFLVIAPLLVGAMFKLWRDSISKVQGALPRFAEGVVGFKGEGTETSDSNLVLMSKGETMTSAKGTRKYKGILEGIHSDDINSIWEAVTSDRVFSSKAKTIVNINLDKTNKLLGDIVQHNKEIPKDFGSYIEYEKEGITFRIKLNDRKN